MSNQNGSNLAPPPPPGAGASRQAPADGRPPLPKTLLFSGKNISAVAMGDCVTFGVSSNNNIQIAVPFRIAAGQRAVLYSAPDGFNGRPGEFAEIPEGTVLTYIKALTPDSAPYAIEALRRAGWKGASLAALKAGRAEGLGGTADAPAEVKLTVSVREKDKDGNWSMVGEGDARRFSPQMQVEWVNAAGGFAFKQEATDDALGRLDKELAPLLRSSAPRRDAAAGAPGGPAGQRGQQLQPPPRQSAGQGAPPPPRQAAPPPASFPGPSDVPADDSGGGDDDIPF